MKTAAGVVLVAALVAPRALHAHGEDSGAKVAPLMQQALPDQPGKEGILVRVEFPPAHVDAVHRHPGHAFVYVLEGSVEMQMEGGRSRTLNPGDTFYEKRGENHIVGRNISSTRPAKLLVFFIADQDMPLVLPPAKH